MPVGDRKAQVVFHALAHDNFVWLVVAEGQRIGAVRALIFHFLDIAEKSGAHGVVSLGFTLVGYAAGRPSPYPLPAGRAGTGRRRKYFFPNGEKVPAGG